MFCIKPNQTLTQGRESWSKCTKIWNKKRFVISHHLNQACSDKGKKVQHFFANLFSSQYFFFFFFLETSSDCGKSHYKWTKCILRVIYDNDLSEFEITLG